MFLLITQLTFYDFMKIPTETCNKTSLIRFNFIKLPLRYILNLAAIPSCDVFQVSSTRRSNFETAETFIKTNGDSAI